MERIMQATPTNESHLPAFKSEGDPIREAMRLFLRSMTIRYAVMQIVVSILLYAALKLT
jgi:hypothetical protein